MNRSLILLFILSQAFSTFAQRGCATDELRNLGKSPAQILQEQKAFEKWMVQKEKESVSKNALQSQNETTVYQIPVVVHIIHNGEDIGEGLNISYQQVLSQIQVLNQDFRHLNSDSINTPPLFQPLIADVGFEFVLAKRDPDGFYTNGITRTNGQKSSWPLSQDSELKSLNYWPSEDYLNIWVANIQQYLGWAQFPSSGLIEGGSIGATNNPLTDGVVVRSSAFGSVEYYARGNFKSNYDLGRTASHEIGHFFGLHHIWGPSVAPSCNLDDFVLDTPNSSIKYYNCPSLGAESTSCGSQDMFMNYMDYVDDRCMNLFTIGQKERMVTVIENSPRRASLLTSIALEELPVLDVAVINMPEPVSGTCINRVLSSVTVMNKGTVLVDEVVINLSVNYKDVKEFTYSLSLLPAQDTTLLLSEVQLNEFGNLNFRSMLISVNGVTDDSVYNDSYEKLVFFSEVVTSINENFSSWPQSWAKRSSAPLTNWNQTSAPNLTVDNAAAQLKYYKNPSAFNDNLVSQATDLSNYTTPYLIFDYAYGERDGYIDALSVLLSLDCGNTFIDTLFSKSGGELATTWFPANFTPSGPSDWRTAVIDLSLYKGQPIQLAFVGSSGGGNNIYLDNFNLVDRGYKDVSLKGLINESGAFSSSVSSIDLIIENTGTTTIQDLTIVVTEDKNQLISSQYSDLNLLPGKQHILEIENIFLEGPHLLSFRVDYNDSEASNNKLIREVNFLSQTLTLPARENFNTELWNIDKNWTISSPLDFTSWSFYFNTGNFLSYPAYTKGNAGLHDWLVLPMIDLSNTGLASLQYNLAYAGNSKNSEVLRIWLSINGGKSFDFLLEEYTGKQMATNYSNLEWVPTTSSHWQTRYLDLREFVGEEEVFIAFQSIDGDGNNIYLDEIELFVTESNEIANVGPNEVSFYPNPISSNQGYLTFNLEEKQDIVFRITDLTGKIVQQSSYKNVLNQTYQLESSEIPNGVYLAEINGPSFRRIIKFIVRK